LGKEKVWGTLKLFSEAAGRTVWEWGDDPWGRKNFLKKEGGAMWELRGPFEQIREYCLPQSSANAITKHWSKTRKLLEASSKN